MPTSPVKTALPLLAAFLLASPCLEAADTLKTRKLDSLEGPPPKQSFSLGTAKVITTKDREHAKVLEFTSDYPHPFHAPGITLGFKPGSANPKKYSGFRIWLRSDNETTFGILVNSSFARKDNKLSAFGAGRFKGNGQWQEFIMPFNKLVRCNLIDQKVRPPKYISGGDAPDESDIQGFSSISFISGVGDRGNDGLGHLMLHNLELIEK